MCRIGDLRLWPGDRETRQPKFLGWISDLLGSLLSFEGPELKWGGPFIEGRTRSLFAARYRAQGAGQV